MSARHFLVVGDPIAHSLSPTMHAAALAALDLPHRYGAERVAPNELASIFARLRGGDIDGFNVTVPHKIAAIEHCDDLDEGARSVGAVNTVIRRDNGRVVGFNTDVDGLADDWRGHDVRPGCALVIGAGGAARATITALHRIGASVSVVARDREKSIFQGVSAIEWSTPSMSTPFDLVVQTTPCGMLGGPPSEAIASLFDRVPTTPGAVAYDVIYRAADGSRETTFLRAARARGLVAIDGAGMLAAQGARALALFVDAPIADRVRPIMRAALVDALSGPRSPR